MSGRIHAYLDRRVPNNTEIGLWLYALRLAGGVRRGFVVDFLDLATFVAHAKA